MGMEKYDFLDKFLKASLPEYEEAVEVIKTNPAMLLTVDYLTDSYFELQNFYRALFGLILVSATHIYKVDKELEKRGHLPAEDNQMNFFQKYDLSGSKFIYLRSWVHIERLSMEELEVLKNAYRNAEDDEMQKKAIDIVMGTYADVLSVSPETPDMLFEMYPSIGGEGLVTGDSIVFAMKTVPEYDENGMYVDFEEFKKKNIMVRNVGKQLETIFSEKLNHKVIILQEE